MSGKEGFSDVELYHMEETAKKERNKALRRKWKTPPYAWTSACPNPYLRDGIKRRRSDE